MDCCRRDSCASSPNWYVGPTLLQVLETAEVSHDRARAPLRFPVQLVAPPTGHWPLGDTDLHASVKLVLDNGIDISRGDMLAHADAAPQASRSLSATLCSPGDAPLDPGGASGCGMRRASCARPSHASTSSGTAAGAHAGHACPQRHRPHRAGAACIRGTVAGQSRDRQLHPHRRDHQPHCRRRDGALTSFTVS